MKSILVELKNVKERQFKVASEQEVPHASKYLGGTLKREDFTRVAI